jgi:hypothetical protein
MAVLLYPAAASKLQSGFLFFAEYSKKKTQIENIPKDRGI